MAVNPDMGQISLCKVILSNEADLPCVCQMESTSKWAAASAQHAIARSAADTHVTSLQKRRTSLCILRGHDPIAICSGTLTSLPVPGQVLLAVERPVAVSHRCSE